MKLGHVELHLFPRLTYGYCTVAEFNRNECELSLNIIKKVLMCNGSSSS